MAKSTYAKTWKDAKKAYETAVSEKKPAEKTMKILLLTIKRGAGIEKALATFDAAVGKGNRKDVALAYNKAWELCGAYTELLGQVAMKLPMEDRKFPELQNLALALNQIVTALPGTLKQVQEAKGAEWKVHPFLADFEGELKNFVKAVKADKQAVAAEKEYKIGKNAEKCLKTLKEYVVAGGRADAPAAKQALDDFVAACLIFEKNCDTIHHLVSGLNGYSVFATSVAKFASHAKAMRIGRVETERKSLAAIADG